MAWFLKHKRRMGLIYASLLNKGFHGSGYKPVLDIRFGNQIFYSKDDTHIFYDDKEIEAIYNHIRIEAGREDFIQNFKNKDRALWSKVSSITKEIMKKDLRTIDDKSLKNLMSRFVKAFCRGPLITIQLLAVEAITSESELSKFLDKRASSLGLDPARTLQVLQTKRSVIYKETEYLLKCIMESKIDDYKKRYYWMIRDMVGKRPKISTSNRLTAYLDRISTKKSYDIPIMDKEQAEIAYQEHTKKMKSMLKEKESLIRLLNPNRELSRAINTLEMLSKHRDWSKQKYIEALIAYNKMIEEVGRRNLIPKTDLLYHSVDELFDILDGKKIDVKERKKSWALISKEGKTKLISGKRADEFKEKEEKGDFRNASILVGTTASKGTARGKARVICNPKDINQFKQGEILVTYSTTMDYIELFQKAKAVITEEGGITSHAAIVSREYDIPCIIGVKDVTNAIKTGDTIHVSCGKIEVIK